VTVVTVSTELLADLVNALINPWTERVEYSVPTCTHTAVCVEDQALLTSAMLKHHVCMCPLHIEHRVDRVRQASLLDQLTGEASGYSPTQLGGVRGGKPESKPPATLDMLELVGTIDSMLSDQAALGSTRYDKLRSLVTISLALGNDEWTKQTCNLIRRYIKTARIMLHYDVPSRVLRDVVCGECGGALVVAIDATSDVRCVGDEQRTSCGQVYARYAWVDLLER
jgi:hypothetical protein